jgi:hypothetical protein
MAKKLNKLVARIKALEDAFAKLLSGQAAAKKTKREKAKKAAPAKRKSRKTAAPAKRKPAAMTGPRKAAPKPARKKRKPRILATTAAPMVPQILPDSV